MMLDNVYLKDRVYDKFDLAESEYEGLFVETNDWWHPQHNECATSEASHVSIEKLDIVSNYIAQSKVPRQFMVTVKSLNQITAYGIFSNCWLESQFTLAPTDEREKRALAIIDDIYALSKTGSDVALLRACFSAIESAFARSEIEVVNLMLEKLDPSRVPAIASLGIARATARAKSVLPHWFEYVTKLKVYLLEQGESVSHTMRGIISKNDQLTFTTRRSLL